MSIDFPLILLITTVFTGVVAFVDLIYSWTGKGSLAKKSVLIEYCRAFFPVLLIVFVIRSFIIQPYRVPTGSLEPTIMPGDFILVSQYAYGLHFPVWDKRLVAVGEPKRGQIALFYYPVNKNLTFVKRVIGLPGDRVSYINKVLYIDGKKMPQKFIGYATDSDGSGPSWQVKVYEENLAGVKHKIYIRPDQPAVNFYNLKIPKGHYFMMGDNRDNSDDSRYWGFVPDHDLIGRALVVWMSWDSNANWLNKIRWDRIGQVL